MTTRPISTTTTLLLTSLPPKSHVGIDLSSFTSTPSFAGIKLLPPGLHHVWISPAPSLSLRSGYWLLCLPDTTQSLSYSPDSEDLIRSEPPSQITPETWTRALTPYRQRLPTTGEETPSSSTWSALISHVTPSLVNRVLGEDWSVSTTTTNTAATDDDDEDDLAEAARLPSSNIPAEKMFAFTRIDLKRTWPATAVGRERTEMARDRSWALARANEAADGELLGEMELAFVAGLYLGNYASARQWRRILQLVLTCRSAVVGEMEGWFCEFLRSLRREAEVLAGWGESAGFLSEEMEGIERALRGFGKMLREEEEEEEGDGRGREVAEEFEGFAKWAERRLDWVLDTRDLLRKGMVQTEEGDMVEVQDEGLEAEEETGEYAPVIVMEEGASEQGSRCESPLEIQMADPEGEDDPRL